MNQPESFNLTDATFRALMQSAPDGMIIVDRGGRILFANTQAEHMFGYGDGELVGQPIEVLVPERYRGDHEGHRERYFAHPRTRLMAEGATLSGRRKDGTVLPVEIALAPLEIAGGRVTTAIVRDITERRKLDLLKEQFLSILSHELRTPINAIMGFASILDDEVAGPLTPEQHTYMARILRGSEVLLMLIDDLLDMSRIQAGKFRLTPSTVDLAGLVAEVCDTLRPLAEQKRHTLACDVDGVVGPIVADAQRVRQILVNLVNNAVKFTPQGGRIDVALWRDDREVHCEVKDTGVGIAESDVPRLFIPFSQVDMSNTRRAGGAGLGLSIVKALVAAHGGRIGVMSVPGAGSTFWFTLPLAGPPPPPSAGAPPR